MISMTSKILAVLGVAAAIALAITPADAKSTRKTRSTASTQGIHVPSPSIGRSYNYYGGSRGSGVSFGDGRMGANYNPNQG